MALFVAAALFSTSVSAAPQVALTRSVRGMTQLVGGSAASDDFVLTNFGDQTGNVTVTQQGNFFTVSPSSFTLAPLESRSVTIRSSVQQGGFYDGTVSVSVAGVQQPPLSIKVRQFVGTQPNGSVRINTATPQLVLSGVGNQQRSASANFANFGSAGMSGVFAADVPWIAPQGGVIGISSNSNGSASLTVDPLMRPDGFAPLGASVGNVALTYVTGTIAGKGALQQNNQTSARVNVEVFDIAKATLVPQQPGALAAGETAVFIPNFNDVGGFFSDLFLSNRTLVNQLTDLRLFYNLAGGAPATTINANIGTVAPGLSAWFPVALRNLFNVSNQTGSVQARSAQIERLAMSGLTGIRPDGQNRYLTAMPVLRSNTSVASGDRLLFSGIEKSTAVRTDILLQETHGVAGTYTIDYFDTAGAPVAPSANGNISAFQFLNLRDAAPAGARAARVTNTSGAAGTRLGGYAAVIDERTLDAWTILDPSRLIAGATELRIPLPNLQGAPPTTTDVYVTNGSATPAPVTIETTSSTSGPDPGPSPTANPRRRIVGRSDGDGLKRTTSETQNFTLAPLETRRVTITDAPLRYVRVTGPAGAISATGRVTSTAAGRLGSFGTGVPALPLAVATGSGTLKRFSRADELPGISPATLLLLETSGRPATVRVTVRFNFPAGALVSGQLAIPRTYEVAAGELVMIPEVTRTIIGPQRDSLGRLFNLVFDTEVIGGEGRILSFLQTTDPSGDITIGVD